MKHISILVPEGAILGSLEGSRQLLTQVNQFLKMRDEDPLFKVQLVGIIKRNKSKRRLIYCAYRSCDRMMLKKLTLSSYPQLMEISNLHWKKIRILFRG